MGTAQENPEAESCFLRRILNTWYCSVKNNLLRAMDCFYAPAIFLSTANREETINHELTNVRALILAGDFSGPP